jgi:transcriptional regulator
VHIPKLFAVNDNDTIYQLIKNFPLGIWINYVSSELQVDHIPFVLDVDSQGQVVLCAHINKANKIWQQIDTGSKTLVVFQGPQAYVSPSWYPSKSKHGKVVPTWNYMVVHAHGQQTITTDEKWLTQQLTALTKTQEVHQPEPWSIDDAPADYISKMVNSIVGIEITITKLEAMWKVSQNKNESDRQGVAAGLELTGSENAMLVAYAVKQKNHSSFTTKTNSEYPAQLTL